MENSKLSGHRVIFACSYPQYALKQCSIHSLLREQSLTDAFQKQCSVHSRLRKQSLTDALHIDYPIKYEPNHAWLGSSNGLICIFVDLKDLILWNPSTRKSKKLPSIGTNLQIYRHIVAYGFGFDEYKDDYNVVLIVRLFEEERGYKYSLRTDSWKRVGDLEGTGIPLSNSINLVSGKLHWSTSPETSSGFRWEIVCLDFESGVCGILDQPDYGGSDIALTLGVLGGCLCILCYEIDTHVDVWVLKEYGVKGSWTKLFRFPCVDRGGRFVFLKPLCMLPNGEILLIFGRSLVFCNPACGSFRVREVTNFDRVEIYVETLVSPAVK